MAEVRPAPVALSRIQLLTFRAVGCYDSLFQPQLKRKRGSQTGKRKESHSAKRVSTMFDSNDNQPNAHQYRFEGTHRPVQTQTQFQELQLDAWVSNLYSRLDSRCLL